MNEVTRMNALQIQRMNALKTQLADSGYDYKQGELPWDSTGNTPNTVTLTNRVTVFSCGIQCATLSVGKEGFAAVDEACSNKMRRDMHSICAVVNEG